MCINLLSILDFRFVASDQYAIICDNRRLQNHKQVLD